MMKKIASLIVLLALCIPTLAVDMPNMIGNWTGSYEGVGFENITISNPDGNLTSFKIGETTWTISIEEQNGAGFVGKKSSTTNPVMQKLVGIIGFDNKTLYGRRNRVLFGRNDIAHGDAAVTLRKWQGWNGSCQEHYNKRVTALMELGS